MAEPDVLLDAVLGRGLADVIEDRWSLGDGAVLEPRLERVAEGVQVRVGADAWIAEQIPGPPDRVTRLQDQVALARLLSRQVGRGSDSGDPRADDQDVDVCCHVLAFVLVLRLAKRVSTRSIALRTVQ